MAFHVACPITCRRICFCTLGFPTKLQREKERRDFLEEVFRVEELLKDPWSIRAGGRVTVQVPVPRIVPPLVTTIAVDGFDGGGGGDGEEILSAQKKRIAMQKKAVEESLAAEQYVRKFETGDLTDVSGEAVRDLAGEDQSSSIVKIMCRICLSGESEGSDRAIKMLSCKICSKKYHRSCLRSWGRYRDLFHWSSWACPSCRICEVCRRAGDPNKFMFCKRCDGAYHCYCQQPPHKNVTSGPFLCSKHTRCHSCGSTAPGNGLSTRWFLGYTCCDACGRLFVKGNYCPVCLKVYRDSESTPMVCCDSCQRWVHCQCDGISDEKYLQFQVDGKLFYKCAACRGDCYQVMGIEDAIQEIWRRRDKADRDQISTLRAAAGLPSQEELFSISPYSDDEENCPVLLKNDYGKPLKFSVKGLVEKGTKNTKEYGKKSLKSLLSNKKSKKKKGYEVQLIAKTEESHQSFERLNEARLSGTDDVRSYRTEVPEMVSPPITRSPGNNKEKSLLNQLGITNHRVIEEVVANNKTRTSKVLQIKSSKTLGVDVGEGIGKHASKTETVKGTKLVIHMGARNRNVTNSPRSEASSCQRDQDLATSNGSEDTSKKKDTLEIHDVIAKVDDGKGIKISKHKGKERSLIKLGKAKSVVSDLNPKIGRGNITEELESTTAKTTRIILGRSIGQSATTAEPVAEVSLRNEEVAPRKQSKGTPINFRSENHDSTLSPSVSESVSKDPKPLLKLKFKTPYLDNRSSWAPQGEEEKNFVKGQRSKRKRPSSSMDKLLGRGDDTDGHSHRENPIDEDMDANWILKKLAKSEKL
ncbi:PHD finger family protein isoform X2 [Tasmannia lanceolata]|uniref:PHD finger family protein isoform X2 n=1 Tax=Tasmannia lanceolata TaxID=3420 RepID=UPI0040643781